MWFLLFQTDEHDDANITCNGIDLNDAKMYKSTLQPSELKYYLLLGFFFLLLRRVHCVVVFVVVEPGSDGFMGAVQQWECGGAFGLLRCPGAAGGARPCWPALCPHQHPQPPALSTVRHPRHDHQCKHGALMFIKVGEAGLGPALRSLCIHSWSALVAPDCSIYVFSLLGWIKR